MNTPTVSNADSGGSRNQHRRQVDNLIYIIKFIASC